MLVAYGTPASAIVVDGSITGDAYGAPKALQNTNTEFGDNDGVNKGSELDGAYGQPFGGKLYLALTGNLEDNFNKLVVFIDSKPGGQNILQPDVESGGINPVVDRAPDVDFSPGMFAKLSALGLSTFDTGFAADYVLVLRTGFTGATNRFDVDFAALGGATSQHLDVFNPLLTNSGVTGTGVNAFPIEVGFDNSNVQGVTSAGPYTAPTTGNPQDVTTGVEIALSLMDLGGPALHSEIKVTAFISNSNHDYISNQFLGTGILDANLGSNGFGGYVPDAEYFFLDDYAGDQYFVVSLVPEAPASLLMCGVATAVATGCWVSRRLTKRS